MCCKADILLHIMLNVKIVTVDNDLVPLGIGYMCHNFNPNLFNKLEVGIHLRICVCVYVYTLYLYVERIDSVNAVDLGMFACRSYDTFYLTFHFLYTTCNVLCLNLMTVIQLQFSFKHFNVGIRFILYLDYVMSSNKRIHFSNSVFETLVRSLT